MHLAVCTPPAAEKTSILSLIVELEDGATVSTGLLREAPDGAHRSRERGKLYPDRIGAGIVARGAGRVRG